jgi:hypothetical protein
MTLELIRKAVPRPLVNRLWQQARSAGHEGSRSCPACKRRMAEVPITPAPDRTLRLDVCVGCHFVWFDPREFEALPKLPRKPAEQETLSPQAREAMAMMRLEALKEQSAMSDIPCIGASGGISGVLAYYCLRFPRASVGMLWYFRWVRMPVGVMFALWVLMQFFGAVELSAGIGNVAVYAHLGGAAVGVLFWWWTRRPFSADAASPVTRPLKTT